MSVDEKLCVLQEKITLLKTHYSSLKAHYEMLQKEHEIIKQELEQKNQYVTELERKYNNLELAKAVSDSSGEHTVARKQIEEIIREIDNCIALLQA